MVFLGVDVGSSGSKCVAFNEHGQKLAMKYAEYETASGTLNLPSEFLINTVFSVISGCVAEIEDKNDIAAITVSSFGESFVPISKSGKPLTEIIMYFADKARTELDYVVNTVGSEEIMNVTRTMPDTMYALPKMMWTKKNVREPVWKYLSIANYVMYVLTGETVTDYTLACRTLLFDMQQLCWSDKLLNVAGIDKDQMPQAVPSGTIVGKVLPGVAGELGLSSVVTVITGAQDQIVNALGAGVLSEGECVDGIGTVECITPMFKSIPSLDFTRHNYVCIPYFDGYVTYAFTFSGGSLVKWFRDTLAGYLSVEAKKSGCSIYDLLNAGCPKEPSGMYVVPHFQGAGGTPEMIKSARGLLYGLTISSDVYDIYRAVLEGITFEMAYNLEALSGFGISPKRIFASGGGARSNEWLQIKADIFDREFIPVAEEECGALGSAMLAATKLGCCKHEAEAVELFVRYRPSVFPNTKHLSEYKDMFGEYKKLRKIGLSFVE